MFTVCWVDAWVDVTVPFGSVGFVPGAYATDARTNSPRAQRVRTGNTVHARTLALHTQIKLYYTQQSAHSRARGHARRPDTTRALRADSRLKPAIGDPSRVSKVPRPSLSRSIKAHPAPRNMHALGITGFSPHISTHRWARAWMTSSSVLHLMHCSFPESV